MAGGAIASGGEVIAVLLDEYDVLAKLLSTCLCPQIIAAVGLGQG